jgi:hypothetical protein
MKYLPVFWEHAPFHQRQHIWFMHNGAPAHFLRTAREYPNQSFGDQWKGRGGLVSWPARHLTDFWRWRRLKILVYSAAINDLEVLQQQVGNTGQEIWIKPEIFNRARVSVWERAGSCVETPGNHIEHLLLKPQEHRPYLSRHRFLNISWRGLLCSFEWLLYPLKNLKLFLPLCISQLLTDMWKIPRRRSSSSSSLGIGPPVVPFWSHCFSRLSRLSLSSFLRDL